MPLITSPKENREEKNYTKASSNAQGKELLLFGMDKSEAFLCL